MNGVDCPRSTELCSDCVWSKVIGNFWVKRTAQRSEWVDSIFLSYLENDAWSRCHMINHSNEFRQNSLIHLEEFFCCRFINREHLHSRDLKSLLKNHIDNLSSKTLCDNMGLDNTACAIVESCRCCKLLAEIEGALSVEVGSWGATMDSVSHAVGSEDASDGVSWCHFGVGWPN